MPGRSQGDVPPERDARSHRAARHAARLLRACVRGTAWRTPSREVGHLLGCARGRGRGHAPTAGDALVVAAAFHGVAGYADRALRLAGVRAAGALEPLESLRAGALYHHLRALEDLPAVGGALDGAGVPWLVVKGPVLAELHGAPDLRAYGDLDVVVPAEGFADALAALEAAGARVVARNWWHRRAVLAGELPLVLPSGTLVDLHWHLLGHRATRRRFALSMPDLFDRAQPVTLGGRSLATLDPADATLYVALHASLSGANRLVWLKDVERLLERGAPDAGTVAERAAASGLGLVVATVLAKTRATLATPVADDALARLDAGRTWLAVAALARRLPPPERAGPGPSLDRVVSRATGADLAASLRELARRGGRWTRSRTPGTAPELRPVEAPADARADDEAGRRAFLAAVTHQRR